MTKREKAVPFMKKYLSHVFLGTLVIFLTLSIGITYWFQHPQKNKSTVIVIKKGSSLSQISTLLAQQQILNFPLLFKSILYGSGHWRHLQAGEYLIPSSITPIELVRILTSGNVLLHPITLVEGETSHNIAHKISKDARFQGACEVPPEGSLLPETYAFPRGTGCQRILARMQMAMQNVIREMWAQRPQNHPLQSPEELVILASIVEKETSLLKERPIVAAVFLNRLKKGMPLQADPTIHYALTDGKRKLGRALCRKDLLVESTYNTYLNKGLPSAPISNPSLSSLKAVICPADVPYLYFVANGSGGHLFSTNLKEHQKNHAAWRKVRAQKSR